MTIKMFSEELGTAKNFVAQDDFGKAEEILKELYEYNPSDKATKVEYGRVLLHSRSNTKLGLKLLNEVVNEYDDGLSIIAIARYYFETGDIDLSRMWYKKIIELDKTTMFNKVYYELAIIEYNTGNLFRAKNYCKQIKDPKYIPVAKVIMAFIALQEENYQKVFKICDEIINNDSNEEHIYSANRLRIISLIKLKKYNEAAMLLDTMPNLPNIAIFKIAISKKANIFFKSYGKTKLYSVMNAINYDEDAARYHVRKHLTEEDTTKCRFHFYDNINPDILFDIVKEQIKDKKPVLVENNEKYVLDLEFPLAKMGQSETTKIMVVTYLDTKDIITFYPIHTSAKVSEDVYKKSDLSTDNNISQIDKFYQRYAKRAR